MSTILDKIMATKAIEIQAFKAKHSYAEIEAAALAVEVGANFKTAITNVDYQSMKVIAEVKKASPSKGIIDPNFDPMKTAQGYADFGANAMSVLTDVEYFQGSAAYLKAISQAYPQIPCLRKDFIADEVQILEARALGASAVLLILACLEPKRYAQLHQFAKDLGLSVLSEVHDEAECEAALENGAEILGVNNRNLHTFEISLSTSLRLRPMVPAGIPFVAESGIATAEDIQELLEAKVDCVLVGESLMRQGAQLLKTLKAHH